MRRRGATLVELLIAFGVLAATSTMTTSAVLSYLSAGEGQKHLTHAMGIAQSKVEDLLVLYADDPLLDGAHGPERYDAAGAPTDSTDAYQVSWTGRPHPGLDGLLVLEVSVTWTEGLGQRSFAIETARTGP